MKVAFISHIGWNLYLFRLPLMQALRKRGYDVYAIAPEDEYTKKIRDAGIKTIEYQLDRNGLNPLNEVKTIHSLYKVLKTEGFDIIHLFNHKPNIYGALAGKLAGIKYIINNIAGLGYAYTNNSLKSNILKAVYEVGYRLAFRHSHKIIFYNTDDIKEFGRYITDKDKITLIKGSGIDTEYYKKDKVPDRVLKKVREELRIKKEEVVILFVGRFLWSKGLRELANSAGKITREKKNVVFVLLGKIDDMNLDSVDEEFIKNLEGSGVRVVQREDVREVIAAADMFCLPSYREGIPMSVLEAMSMGKPIIVTDAPGCRETVVDSVNGVLVKAKDSKSLTTALERLIKDRKLREKMGEKSREKAVSEFSLNKIIKENVRIYEDIKGRV
ncbi:MAG: glycosyltransferase family 4 protein [Candidatus Altiarchaeota archaeon]|nr:glycosyltransferase family 4 protein [Candidatus Altiarchaeota archaeon]